MKMIQIPESLFVALMKYHVLGIEDCLPEIKIGLEQVQTELQEDTQKVVEKYVKAKTDAAMKKDFLHFVTQENPKSELTKLASKVWKSFKTWWERTKKKPEVEKAAKESVLKKLQRSKQEVAEAMIDGSRKVNKKKDQYR